MASRNFSRALRSPLTKQLSAPARRTFVSALNASARPSARVVASAQQVRGVKTIDFAGTKEVVYGMYGQTYLKLATNTRFREGRLAGCKAPGIFLYTATSANSYLQNLRNTSRMTPWPLLDTDRKVMPNH
jgi:hypothetical protein